MPLALAPQPALSAAASTSTKERSNLQKEQRTIKGQISSIKKDIEQKQARVDSANQELRASEKAISDSNRTLKELGAQKSAVENQLADLKREADIVGMHVTEAEDLVAVITQAQFLNSRRHPWQAALTGDNPNDITRMSAILRYMAREQDRTIDRLANRRKNIEVVTAKTNATQKELSRIEADEQKNRDNLEKEKSRRESAVNELKKELNTQRERYEQLVKNDRQLTNLIANIDKQIEAVKRSMREWRYIAKRFWFWAYDINFFRYLGYFDSFGCIQKNVEGFHDYGIEYLSMQGPHDSHNNWQANMRAYVYRKMLWDCTLNADALMNEYIDLYYGMAAGAVRRVMEIFHNNYLSFLEKGEKVTFITRGTHTDAKYNPKEMLEECIAVLERAEDEALCSDLSQKHKNELFERLEQVKATPLMLLVDHFDEYYPGDTARKEKYFHKYYKCVVDGKVDTSGERWSMRQYLKEIGCTET